MPKYVEKISQQEVSKLHDEDDEGSDNTSGLSSLVYSGSNEEVTQEYLRSTWTRLGVGHDGYLSLEELTKVCHTIGMEKVASEVIEQLFSRLDVDGDGRISFEEFFHMFKSGIPSHSTSFNLDESQNQDSSLMLNTNCLSSVNTTSSGLFLTDYDVFSTLDPDGTGYASVSRIVEIWFAMGISDGCHLLRDLGLPHRQRERIYLKDLAAVLEEEWRPQQDSGTYLPRHAAFLTLIYEIRGLRVALEAARGERDKSRWDLNKANHRLSLLAQELDEHNVQIEEKTQHKIQSLEKQYKEQIRDLQESLSRERDCGREKALNESNEILSMKMQLQEEEAKLKSRIHTLEKDVKRLEAENIDMSDRLKDADHHLHSMEKQIGQLNHLKNKVAEYESLSPREEEFRNMCHRIEELMSENHKLRDSNDELIAQLDSVSANNFSGKIEDKSLDGSCIGDYLDQSCDASLQGGVKRRVFRSSVEEESSGPEEDSPRESKIRKKSQCVNGANIHYVDVTSYDESFLDTSLPSSLYSKSPQHPHVLNSTKESVLSSHSFTSQPSSLPLSLFQSNYSSPKDRNCELRKRLDKRKKVDELEKEVESLKEEREKLSALVQEKKSSKNPSVSSDSEKEESSVKVLPPISIVSVTSKCLQCIELESRLNLAIEELEMSLRRESQKQNDFEKEQDISLQQIQFLIQHCKELEEELSSVKTEVSNLMDERDQLLAEKENMKLDFFKKSNESISNLIENLCRELSEKIQRKRQALMTSSVSTRSNEKSRDAITTIMEEEEPEDGDETVRDDASETSDGLTLDRIDDDMDTEDTIQERVRQMLEKLETQISFFEEDMNREKDFQEKQKAMAEEKCRKAEHDLENIRCEFEKSDDYWNLKLQEEQDYYDEERKLYDEKFSALEAKIREYEEMAMSVPEVPTEILGPTSVGSGSTEEDPDRWPAIVGNISEDSDRLSTIDESVVWEKQVTELEDEVARLSKMVLLLQDEKENLMTTWIEKVAAEQRTSSKLKMDLEQTRALFNKLESQANFNKEQLEHLKKNLVRESDLLKLANEEQSKTTKEDASTTNLWNQLKYFQNQTKRLENSLKLHQKNSTEILNITHERHKSEIQSLEAMMAATQQMFTTNLAKYKDQLSKTTRSDSLLKELYVENAQLMVALAVTETRQKEAEVCARKYQMAALSSLSL